MQLPRKMADRMEKEKQFSEKEKNPQNNMNRLHYILQCNSNNFTDW